MASSDEIEVLWKTKCEWHDTPHTFKRKEIKPKDMKLAPKEAQTVSLHKGQAVRVKFGHKWWDAEMTEDWEPSNKRGM